VKATPRPEAPRESRKDGKPLLLNPAEEDPRPHLLFVRAHLLGLTERGVETVRLVELDRPPLRNERASWLSMVDALLVLCAVAKDERVRQECRGHLIWTMQDDAPYAGMTRAYLRERCPRLANPPVPHRWLPEGDRCDRIRALVEQYPEELGQLE